MDLHVLKVHVSLHFRELVVPRWPSMKTLRYLGKYPLYTFYTGKVGTCIHAMPNTHKLGKVETVTS